jgi:type III secretion protein V
VTGVAGSRRPAELAIAVLVIAVVAMLIVPLPTALLDILLVLNIAVAVVMLMAAVFSPRPLHFASFPTLLVVTTLFRVGLEVSATRLILRDGDAGAVVSAFGGSVAGDSLIVGLVVFAVITIVQLIVVARGAERVAEVSARFALDAMPGKQMAIDAELRAGAIDGETARKRRTDLERESQLYGAMDGAMRFVKGDAIAAIVIVVINLIAGLAIGVGSRGMSAGDAAQTYALLSIGEGLVAQIPSLLVAVASGLLVTRVASTGNQVIGADLGEQLGGQPRALAAAAILLVGLGLVPGLPLAPFLLLGLAAGTAALVVARAKPPVQQTLDEDGASLVRGPRLALRISPQLRRDCNPADLRAAAAAARAKVTRTTGIPLPPLAITIDDSLEHREAAIAIDATPVAWFTVFEADRDGFNTPSPQIQRELETQLPRLAPELLGVDRVAQLLETAAVHVPVTVREVVPKLIGLPVLAELLRELAREGLSIEDLAAILEAIAISPLPAGGHASKDVPALADTVRSHLRRQITARWAPRGQLAVFTVDAMIEDAVRTSIDRRDGAQILALEPAIAHDIVTAVKAKLPDGGVILASGDVRRHLRMLLEPELPGVAVLAAHELAPNTTVRTSGRIEV